jgi:predicted RNA-binding Zn ribbon-like protein
MAKEAGSTEQGWPKAEVGYSMEDQNANQVDEVGAQRVPGELELVRQFVNTYDVEDDLDEIGSPEELRGWLGRHGLEAGPRIGEQDVEQARRLRDALRALTLANNGEPLDPQAIPALNAVAAGAQLQVRFGAQGEPHLEPAGEGAEAALGRLLAIVFGAMADGTWGRLKACREHSCQWAFYDLSKNRSATWCSMKVCGNRNKARAFRARQRGKA